MKRIYKALSLILATAFGLTLFSCVKDLDEKSLTGLEGDCDVAFELQGMPLQSALTRTSGNAIRSIRNLYVLFYAKGDTDADNYELAYAFTSDTDCANDVFAQGLKILTKQDTGRTPGTEFNPNDGEWKGVAESTTQSVTTSEVQVQRGSYAVYVVANVDDFSKAAFSKADIATPGALRNYDLIWESKVADNDAMFGFFTEDSTKGYDVINETAPVIRFTANVKTIHAWVKRAVSKVTVAFDGSKLRNGVRVYIKDIAIHDIPATCKLGANNSPESMEELITNGEQIVFTDKTGVTTATRISSREPYFPNFKGLAENEEDVAKWKEEVHSESANALYFFENRQGKSSSGATDGDGSWKQQTDTNDNNIPDDRDTLRHPGIDPNKGILKDTKTYGSYIEVTAYYQNDNFGAKTEGTIIYRFMLGKNTTNDFNADRNNHYKLTMRFKNNANDVDWHIDYSDKIGEYIPDKIYVSYEYNTPSMLPIRLVGKEFTNLTVTINSSNWYPDDSNISHYTGTTTPTGLATGFLSLTYDENPRISANEHFGVGDAENVTSYWNNQANNTTRKYIDNGNKVTWTDLDKHGYNVTTRINSEGNKVFEANIPLFTRPLIIYKWTSWTGANPYYSATRSAKITLTGDIDGDPFTKQIEVIQVRRVENPSGIYRRHDNTDPFDVTLMERKGEMYNSAISYAPFKSIGKWRAIIYRSTSGRGNEVAAWFSLTAGAQKADATGEYIEGDEGEYIKFTFAPNGVITQNQVRCGIIKVEYNDYTCTHYICVRQGYAPIQLETPKNNEKRVYWHTFNLYSGSAETSHPCEAGSFFIRGRWAPAILDSNTAGFGETVSTLSALTNEAGTTTGNVSIPINNSGSYARQNFPTSNRSLSRNNATYNPWNSGRVPTLAEWATLKNENANANIGKAFGVLYGDGVDSTLTNPTNVYGCLHANVNTSNGKAARGMRGSFVYNTSDGRNIFLPIGASGFGRRKVAGSGRGRLQYSYGDYFFSTVLDNENTPYRPLLYNLNTNEGAIYWAQSEVSGIADSTHKNGDNGWDINYKTYDFDYMDKEANEISACYIRLVQDSAPQ